MVITEDHIAKIVKDSLAPLRKDVGYINKNVREIKTHLGTLNNRVGKSETNVRDLQETVRHRVNDCPHSETITVLKENLLTGSALKQYITDQKYEDLQTSAQNMKRFEVVIIGVGVIVTLLNLLINIYI